MTNKINLKFLIFFFLVNIKHYFVLDSPSPITKKRQSKKKKQLIKKIYKALRYKFIIIIVILGILFVVYKLNNPQLEQQELNDESNQELFQQPHEPEFRPLQINNENQQLLYYGQVNHIQQQKLDDLQLEQQELNDVFGYNPQDFYQTEENILDISNNQPFVVQQIEEARLINAPIQQLEEAQVNDQPIQQDVQNLLKVPPVQPSVFQPIQKIEEEQINDQEYNFFQRLEEAQVNDQLVQQDEQNLLKVPQVQPFVFQSNQQQKSVKQISKKQKKKQMSVINEQQHINSMNNVIQNQQNFLVEKSEKFIHHEDIFLNDFNNPLEHESFQRQPDSMKSNAYPFINQNNSSYKKKLFDKNENKNLFDAENILKLVSSELPSGSQLQQKNSSSPQDLDYDKEEDSNDFFHQLRMESIKDSLNEKTLIKTNSETQTLKETWEQMQKKQQEELYKQEQEDLELARKLQGEDEKVEFDNEELKQQRKNQKELDEKATEDYFNSFLSEADRQSQQKILKDLKEDQVYKNLEESHHKIRQKKCHKNNGFFFDKEKYQKGWDLDNIFSENFHLIQSFPIELKQQRKNFIAELENIYKVNTNQTDERQAISTYIHTWQNKKQKELQDKYTQQLNIKQFKKFLDNYEVYLLSFIERLKNGNYGQSLEKMLGLIFILDNTLKDYYDELKNNLFNELKEQKIIQDVVYYRGKPEDEYDKQTIIKSIKNTKVSLEKSLECTIDEIIYNNILTEYYAGQSNLDFLVKENPIIEELNEEMRDLRKNLINNQKNLNKGFLFAVLNKDKGFYCFFWHSFDTGINSWINQMQKDIFEQLNFNKKISI